MSIPKWAHTTASSIISIRWQSIRKRRDGLNTVPYLSRNGEPSGRGRPSGRPSRGDREHRSALPMARERSAEFGYFTFDGTGGRRRVFSRDEKGKTYDPCARRK